MKRKVNEIPDIKINIPAPEVLKAKNAEQTTIEVLMAIRQLEPEQQNDVVKTILKELAIDRHNSVRQYKEAASKANENMDVFMYNAIGLEKILAEESNKKG